MHFEKGDMIGKHTVKSCQTLGTASFDTQSNYHAGEQTIPEKVSSGEIYCSRPFIILKI